MPSKYGFETPPDTDAMHRIAESQRQTAIERQRELLSSLHPKLRSIAQEIDGKICDIVQDFIRSCDPASSYVRVTRLEGDWPDGPWKVYYSTYDSVLSGGESELSCLNTELVAIAQHWFFSFSYSEVDANGRRTGSRMEREIRISLLPSPYRSEWYLRVYWAGYTGFAPKWPHNRDPLYNGIEALSRTIQAQTGIRCSAQSYEKVYHISSPDPYAPSDNSPAIM